MRRNILRQDSWAMLPVMAQQTDDHGDPVFEEDGETPVMVDTGRGSGVNERLDIMNKSNDGFFIAKEDLRLRGPGDFFGIRQSGALGFMIGDLYQDRDMLDLAQELWRKNQK